MCDRLYKGHTPTPFNCNKVKKNNMASVEQIKKQLEIVVKAKKGNTEYPSKNIGNLESVIEGSKSENLLKCANELIPLKSNQRTELDWACANGFEVLVRAILKCGTRDVESNNFSAVRLAVESGHIEVVVAIFEHKKREQENEIRDMKQVSLQRDTKKSSKTSSYTRSLDYDVESDSDDDVGLMMLGVRWETLMEKMVRWAIDANQPNFINGLSLLSSYFEVSRSVMSKGFKRAVLLGKTQVSKAFINAIKSPEDYKSGIHAAIEHSRKKVIAIFIEYVLKRLKEGQEKPKSDVFKRDEPLFDQWKNSIVTLVESSLRKISELSLPDVGHNFVDLLEKLQISKSVLDQFAWSMYRQDRELSIDALSTSRKRKINPLSQLILVDMEIGNGDIAAELIDEANIIGFEQQILEKSAFVGNFAVFKGALKKGADAMAGSTFLIVKIMEKCEIDDPEYLETVIEKTDAPTKSRTLVSDMLFSFMKQSDSRSYKPHTMKWFLESSRVTPNEKQGAKMILAVKNNDIKTLKKTLDASNPQIPSTWKKEGVRICVTQGYTDCFEALIKTMKVPEVVALGMAEELLNMFGNSRELALVVLKLTSFQDRDRALRLIEGGEDNEARELIMDQLRRLNKNPPILWSYQKRTLKKPPVLDSRQKVPEEFEWT